jgi:hypothetical protein
MMGELWAIINPEIAPGVLVKLLAHLVWCLIIELDLLQHVDGHPD